MILSLNLPLQSKVFAMVEGVVKAEDGKVIPGAKIIMIFTDDGEKIEFSTDNKGRFRKPNLRPGTWTLGVMAEGFQPKQLTVELSAIRKNPELEIILIPLPESPFARGDALYKEGKYQEALEEYKRLVEEKPDLYLAYDKIGLCYLRIEDQENAILYFKKMLEYEPDSIDTLINLSAIYFEQGNLEEGMKYFKQLDESKLNDPATFYNIGILFFKNGETEIAINYLKKCISLDSNFVDGYYQLGLANLNKGDLEAAIENFEKVIELEPESERAEMAKKILQSIKKE